MMGTLLMAPEDGKPDNYIMEPFTKGYYRIIAIDNDHNLADPLAKEVVVNRLKFCPQVKSILYCLDQIHDTIHPKIHQTLQYINFFEKLYECLVMLVGYQKENTELIHNFQ